MAPPTTDELRQRCWNSALHAFGTAWWFGERATSLRKKLRALAFLGLIAPVAVGAVVLGFGVDYEIKPLLFVAGVISLAQLLWTLWSMSAGWQEAFSAAANSQKKNTEIYQAWEGLAKTPPQDLDVFLSKVEVLPTVDQMQATSDIAYGIDDRDKRMMMRRGLLQYGRKCATCGKKPESMKTNEKCSTCADF